MKKVLTIAGSDCSGGAGIQADIKTITAHKLYAMSAITALTAQNTMGVFDVLDLDKDFIGKQLDCIFTDIFPDAVKIGMVSSKETIKIIAQKLIQYEAKNIVLDPVMVATSGGRLMHEDAIKTLIEDLFPLSNVITPNLFEAEKLSNIEIKSKNDMIKAAQKISEYYNGAILVKGGHLQNIADDLLYIDGKDIWFEAKREENENTHGTGCTMSSAIACNLAMGYDIVNSIQNAKDYITKALQAKLDLGKGSGPLNHTFNL